jgi:DNA-binding beta-propeller fold protein YncE
MTRRQWLAGSTLLILSACRARKGSGFPGYALISNAGDGSLAVVDLTEFRLLRAIPVGAPASDTIVGQNGRSFVLTPTTGSVHIIDRELRVAKARKFSDKLSAMCLSPDGRDLIAVAPGARELIVADASSLQLKARHKLGAEPVWINVPPAPRIGESAKPRYVAVSSGASGTVELIDYGTGQRWRRDLAGALGAVRFRADGERLLVANLHDRCISALTTPALQTIADLPLGMAPENLCFNADQGQLFVSGEGMDAVAIIFPYNPLEVDQTVLAGRDPGVMACSESPAYLFVGSHNGSDVCILNVDSRKMIGIVDAGLRPTYITVTPDSRYALVLSESAGTMAVIHIPAVAANASNAAKWRNKGTAGLFTLLTVGDRPVHAAVVPRFS